MVSVSLLFTSLLTDNRITSARDYSIDETEEKQSQLLTTLESLKNIDFQETYVYLETEGGYLNYKDFFRDWVQVNLPRAKYSEERLGTFEHWRTAVNSLDSQWTLIAANHDHPFVGKREDWTTMLIQAEKSQAEVVHISHWPEALGWRKLRWNAQMPDGLELGFDSDETIGTTLIRTSLLKSSFHKDFTGGLPFVRPDNPFGPSLKLPRTFNVLPRTEFFRHLDGYGHVGLLAQYASSLRAQNYVDADFQITTSPWRRVSSWQDEGDLLELGYAYANTLGEKNKPIRELRNIVFLGTRYRVRALPLVRLIFNMGGTGKTLLAFWPMLRDRVFWKSVIAPYTPGNLFRRGRVKSE